MLASDKSVALSRPNVVNFAFYLLYFIFIVLITYPTSLPHDSIVFTGIYKVEEVLEKEKLESCAIVIPPWNLSYGGIYY